MLRTIDKGINFPIIFQLTYKNQIKTTMAYKRPSDNDKHRWVVDSYFKSEWMAIECERSSLPVAVNLASLYEQILRQFLPVPARAEETLKEHIERVNLIRAKEAELSKLQNRINKEKQFNRKVELNKQYRSIKAEIEKLQ